MYIQYHNLCLRLRGSCLLLCVQESSVEPHVNKRFEIRRCDSELGTNNERNEERPQTKGEGTRRGTLFLQHNII